MEIAPWPKWICSPNSRKLEAALIMAMLAVSIACLSVVIGRWKKETRDGLQKPTHVAIGQEEFSAKISLRETKWREKW